MVDRDISAQRRIVVTGAQGFVGRALVRTLRARGHVVVGWQRDHKLFELDQDPVGLASACSDWQRRLRDVDVVVHLAARVHHVNEKKMDVAALYQRVNVDATEALATAAARAGVKRMVFFSTAKVYGEGSAEAYSEQDLPMPADYYSQSKWRAEQLLQECSERWGLDLVVLRPPLIYGPGVGGNFNRLWRIAATGWPLPLASVDNRRDMIAIDNLVDIAAHCCDDIRAVGQIFNVADSAPYSLPDLIRAIRRAQGRRDGLWPFPPQLVRGALQALRGAGDVQRLLGDFRVNTTHVQKAMSWTPRMTLAQTLIQMAESQT